MSRFSEIRRAMEAGRAAPHSYALNPYSPGPKPTREPNGKRHLLSCAWLRGNAISRKVGIKDA
jgi:hypothetical protein